MPSIVFLVGLPGSGKSTFRSSFLKAYPDHIVASSDDFIDSKARDDGKTYSEVFQTYATLADAHCAQVIEQSLKIGANVIVDRTNVSVKTRRRFLSKVPDNYVKMAYVFEVEPDVLRARLDARADETGKSIPPFVVSTMRASFVFPTEAEFDLVMKVAQ